jgi:hypothetical protein
MCCRLRGDLLIAAMKEKKIFINDSNQSNTRTVFYRSMGIVGREVEFHGHN